MSIIYSIVIYGCIEGSTGAALAMALAGKPVHVFACAPSITDMPELEDISNISTLSLDPLSDIAFHTAKEQVATKLNGGKLNMIINAGFVGHEAVRGCEGEKRGKLWSLHIRTMKHLALAFKPLLIDSHGTIINLASHEILVHEVIINTIPNGPESIASSTARLRIELEPLGVKLLTIADEGEQTGEDMVSDGPRTWRDVPALAKDIIDDLFRLPGTARLL